MLLQDNISALNLVDVKPNNDFSPGAIEGLGITAFLKDLTSFWCLVFGLVACGLLA